MAIITHATLVSSLLLRCRENMISMDIIRRTIPPAIRKALVLMLNRSRICMLSGEDHEEYTGTKTDLLALAACSFSDCPRVRVMNIGTVANGSKMKNSNVVA